jgi:fermentation-respiration switch protein FrsA (DUF1100 family)
MREKVEVRADDGVVLVGWFRVPEAMQTPPVVVMSQGLGGHKEWALPLLEDVLADAGIATLTYDHRNFGESGGEPRFEVDPQLQIRDCRSVVTYLTTRPEVDGSRVGVFGTSLSGGHAFVVGATDRRVGCIVALVPTVSGWEQAVRRFGHETLAQMRERWDADRMRRFNGAEPELVPHFQPDPDDKVAGRSMNRVTFFESLTADERTYWKNELTLRSLELCMEYEPGTYVARVSPTPLLMIVAEDDRQVGTDLQLAAFARAFEPKKLVMTKGGHYDVYRSEFEDAASATRDWFLRWLLEPTS